MQKNIIWNIQTRKCPYCRAVSAFTCVFSQRSFHKGIYHPVSVWECHHCDRAIFMVGESTTYEGETLRLSVKTVSPADQPSVDALVPEGIGRDYIEAAQCFNISAYKACVVMARRAIQKMCLNLGADKNKKLHQQIDELRLGGKLHQDLAEIATEVRHLGNDGAHPDTDGLDEVGEEDAKEVLEFALELLDDLYVRPEKVKAMKKRREDRNSAVT